MNVLDLFSGIGGFSLGLERAGMRTVAFCEIDPFCRRVLAKHWPDVPCYNDVRALTADRMQADGVVAEVICGGFPCQDISFAGDGAGLGGHRSGLWREYRRIIGEVRPRYVIVENVAALLARGMGTVLSDLASLGYDAEWHCIPASAVGAIHDRDRLWIVAYTDETGIRTQQNIITPGRLTASRRDNAHRLGLAEFRPWSAFADILRAPYGIPGTLDRLGSLGNAVVPQIPEIIGRAIMTSVTHNEQSGGAG